MNLFLISATEKTAAYLQKGMCSTPSASLLLRHAMSVSLVSGGNTAYDYDTEKHGGRWNIAGTINR